MYTSEDAYGPGPITGMPGTLINILDACLVNGYGTGSYYKAPAGWSKPASNSGSSATIPYYGVWQQPSGSKFNLFVNDSGANGVGGGAECMMCGWRFVTGSCTAPGAMTPTSMNGSSGSAGQFPRYDQLLTYGFVCVRKTNNNGVLQRSWVIFADDRTVLMFFLTGDGGWFHYYFGDIYSLKQGAKDVANCIIYGATATANIDAHYQDVLDAGPSHPNWYGDNSIKQYMPGHFIAGPSSGAGGPINFSKRGDVAWSPDGWNYSYPQYARQAGFLAYPNPPDGGFYVSPLWVCESGGAITLRGRYRGLYYPVHPVNTLQTGQTISGSGNYAGKTFMIFTPTYHNGWWAVETSATLETNS